MIEDNFLDTLDNALDGSQEETVETAQEITQETVSPPKQDTDIENAVSNIFDDEEPTFLEKKTQEYQKEAQEEQEKQKKQEKPSTLREVDFSTRPRQRKKVNSEKLLDTYLKEDEKGNLLNGKGDVIALAGDSRNYYEGLRDEARKQRKAATDLAIQNTQLAEQFKKLYDDYKGISEKEESSLQTLVKNSAASEQEITNAVNLLQQYKTDPIAAIKSLLTQAKMDDIDLSQIGANIAVDPAMMKQQLSAILDDRLGPLNQRAEQENLHRAAQEEAQRFLGEYPEAAQYQEHIGKAKLKFPNMSLPEIWLRLKRELDAISQDTPPSAQTRPSPSIQLPQRQVTLPVRDYANMSFDDIAASIKQDTF